MPHYRYKGKAPEIIAQIGRVSPGDVVQVSTEIGDALEKNDAAQWEMVKAPAAPKSPPVAPKAPPVSPVPPAQKDAPPAE